MSQLPVLLVIIPLLSAPLCFICRSRHLSWLIALLASWSGFIISLLLTRQVLLHGPATYNMGGWPAPWGITYHLDVLSTFVLLIVSGVAALVLPYARRSVEREIDPQRQPPFYTLLLICQAGLLGIVSTGDAFNMYVFLELSSLSSYALIGLGQRRRALTAAYQYLIMGTIGATFILIGIGLLYSLTGTLNIQDLSHQLTSNQIIGSGNRTLITAFAFLTVGLSLKLALFPLHLWLPNAYSYAPSVVTIFLAATATKVAVYMLLRFCFNVLGYVELFELTLARIILYPSLAAILVASVVAIFQYDIKRMLAYSSIAQIGYMTLGISLATELGLAAGILHLFNHALMKGLLFMTMGAVNYRVGSVYLSDFRGLGRRMPWTMAAFVLGGLSLMGVPLTAGFISKWYLVQSTLALGWWPVAGLILLGSLLAVIYIWRVVETAYFNPDHEIEHRTVEAPLSLLAPMWLLVAANIYFGIDSRLPLSMARQAASLLLGELMTTALLPLCVLTPLVGALMIALCNKRPNWREAATLLTAATLLMWVGRLFLQADSLYHKPKVLAQPLPGISLQLQLEPLGLLFAGIASLLWLITSLYTIGYMRGNSEQHQTRLYICFAIALASTMGIALAGNLLTLFLFYETLTLSTYPLVAHKQDHDALAGSRFYLGLLLSTSIGLLLPAIIWTWSLAGTTDFAVGGILPSGLPSATTTILLLLFAFGIGKGALMPFHRWLPEAMVAPTPVSALLHAVAVVKAGVFCLVKVVLMIFGPQLLLNTGSHLPLQAIAAFTLLCASIIALRQDNLKRRLAYSTISQLAYITLAIAVLTPRSITGAIVHIAAHAFGKITLFFAAGAIYTAAHKTRVSELNGIGHRMPWTMTAFAIATLSMIGLPPAAGFVSKWYMLQGAAEAENLAIIGVLSLSTLLNAGYFVPIVVAAFFKPESQPPHHPHGEAPWTMVTALTATALLTLIFFFWPDLAVSLAHQLTGGAS